MVGQLDHWTRIRNAYNEYRFHEAADRGYDAEASQHAFKKYVDESQIYKIIYGVDWALDDILIDIQDEKVHNYSGDGKIVWLK